MYNYQPQGQQPYGQQPYQQAYRPMPIRQLKTDRSLLMYILLNMVTFGIYGIVLMSGVSTDINEIASRLRQVHRHPELHREPLPVPLRQQMVELVP